MGRWLDRALIFCRLISFCSTKKINWQGAILTWYDERTLAFRQLNMPRQYQSEKSSKREESSYSQMKCVNKYVCACVRVSACDCECV